MNWRKLRENQSVYIQKKVGQPLPLLVEVNILTISQSSLLTQTLSQRELNEHSNGILRRSGLDKERDFNSVIDDHIINVAQNINHCHRKSLGYKTPSEVFMSFIEDEKLSSLF